MTLPSQLPSTEPAAIPSDPFACLGGASAQNTVTTPCEDSFASVFSQAGEAVPVVMAEPTASPVASVANPSVLYSCATYIGPNFQVGTSLPAAKVEMTPEEIEVLASNTPTEVTAVEEENDAAEQPETAKADDPTVGNVDLAYQLIAGQWVAQPVERPVVLQPAPSPEPKGFGQTQSAGELSGKSVVEPTASVQGADQSRSFAAPSSVSSTSTKPALETATKPKAEAKAPIPFEVTAEKSTPLPSPSPVASPAAEASSAVAKNPSVPATTVTEAGVENAAQAADIRITPDTPEKIAAPRANARAEIASGVNPSNDGKEKKTVIVDGKKVNTMASNVGTRGANREVSMPYSVSNKTASAEFTTTPAVAMSGGIQNGTTAPLAAATAPSEVQAPRLVQEIRAIADRISVIDRNSVEVRFDFNNSEHLSVRVEYRDGTVHTTFRTDSSQLRDVISNEWQAQAAASEQRSYRVADPVFNSPDTKQQESSLGDGSGRQRSYEQSAQSGGAPTFSNPGRSTGATTTVAPLPAARSETSRHLQTFA